MRFKRRSATALLCFLVFFLFRKSSSVDFLTSPKKSEIQDSQDERELSSRYYERINEVLSPNTPKQKYMKTFSGSTHYSQDFEENEEAANVADCELTSELRREMKPVGQSEWTLDNKTLETLSNNPQRLIQCTESGDRIVFNLTGVHKFKKTLIVFHDLEFVSTSPESEAMNNYMTRAAIFTCPDDGPFLRIKSDGFNASGFVIQNCTKSTGEGAVVIESNSKALFENTIFSGNRKRAISAASNSSLTLRLCQFYGNDIRGEDGGAVRLQNHTLLSIDGSSFYGNTAKCGGAIYSENNTILIISSSEFSSNQAGFEGGAIGLNYNTDLKLINATLLGNNAPSGGAIWLKSDNNVTIKNTTLRGNNAFEFGGAICFADHNNAFLANSALLRNTAKWHGGALRLGLHCVVHVEQCEIQGNAANWGGSIYLGKSTITSISNTTFSNNTASRGGVLYGGMDSIISIDKSYVFKNEADLGGCLYAMSLSASVKNSKLWKNYASLSGGCLYIDSSNAYIENNSLTLNDAKEEGGAIYATSGSLLQINKSKVVSNSAFNGGGISMTFNSRILCYDCTVKNNTAARGGGVYIETQTKQILAAQFAMSTFRSNSASQYGGGMAIKTFGNRRYNCSNVVEPCSRVLFINTSFAGNNATSSGSAILATELNHILVACEGLDQSYEYLRSLQVEEILFEQGTGRIKQFRDSSSPCKSWKDNMLIGDRYGQVVGTFGQRISITTNSKEGLQISGSSESGFVLHDVRSTKQFPELLIKTIDAFNNSPAPNLLEKNALVLHSASKLLKDSTAFSFENESCSVSSISSKLPKGTYTIEIDAKEEDVLGSTTLTVSIIECGINEEFRNDTNSCLSCGEALYNFDLSSISKCLPCPEHANCTMRYITPKQGYWHKSPCHTKLTACVSEQSCMFENRRDKLHNLTRSFDGCQIDNKTLAQYKEAQCHSGYEGSLCGSCKESYGLSSSFECRKCGHAIMSSLTLIGITCYLLFGTTVTIKGVLSLKPQGYVDGNVQAPLLQSDTFIAVATSTIQPSEAIEENNNPSQTDDSYETTSPMSTREPPKDEIKSARLMATEAWKILLNFLQVTSTAATLDVKWTEEVLGTMEKLQLLGAATINSISRPIDCLLSYASRSTRVIWRTLFSIFVPMIVIAILALYWGYRAIMVHEREGSYFLKRLLLTIVTIIYITYFDLTQLAVRVFDCPVVFNDNDQSSNLFTRLWIADTSIECYKGSHLVLVGIALVILIFVSGGFHVFFLCVLRLVRDEITTTNSWGYDISLLLCGPYKTRFVYWECVTMIKKATLSIIIVFSYSLGNQAQGLLILMVLVFFLYFHQLCNPYGEEFHSLNYYEGLSLSASCVIYTLVQFLNVDTISEFGRHAISICLIFIVVLFVFIMVYKTLGNVIYLQRLILESMNVEVSYQTNWFAILCIRYRLRRRLHYV